MAPVAIHDSEALKVANRRVTRAKTFLLETARRLLHRIAHGYLRDSHALRSQKALFQSPVFQSNYKLEARPNFIYRANLYVYEPNGQANPAHIIFN
jgi:hypothetical protein